VQRLLETFMRRGLLIDQLFGALLIGLAITVLLRALPPQSG
jgi:threonine/homoserine/homoserine lactone efflux protein